MYGRNKISHQNVLMEQEQQIQDLQLENATKDALLRKWQPWVKYYNAILESPKLLTTTAIATEYGVTAQKLNNYLQENGIQYKRNGTWVLCKPYADKEYTYPQTKACNRNQHTRWTQKGRTFLHDFLGEDGKLPLYERPYAPMDTDSPLW